MAILHTRTTLQLQLLPWSKRAISIVSSVASSPGRAVSTAKPPVTVSDRSLRATRNNLLARSESAVEVIIITYKICRKVILLLQLVVFIAAFPTFKSLMVITADAQSQSGNCFLGGIHILRGSVHFFQK